jgi:hypothetical protein
VRIIGRAGITGDFWTGWRNSNSACEMGQKVYIRFRSVSYGHRNLKEFASPRRCPPVPYREVRSKVLGVWHLLPRAFFRWSGIAPKSGRASISASVTGWIKRNGNRRYSNLGVGVLGNLKSLMELHRMSRSRGGKRIDPVLTICGRYALQGGRVQVGHKDGAA